MVVRLLRLSRLPAGTGLMLLISYSSSRRFLFVHLLNCVFGRKTTAVVQSNTVVQSGEAERIEKQYGASIERQ